MPHRRWTAESLERACRDTLLRRTSVRVGELPMSRSAEVQWQEPNGRAKVRVDHHQVGLRTGTIHELLHVVLEPTLVGYDDDLAESIIVALEHRLDERIANSPRRAAWWRKHISKIAKP